MRAETRSLSGGTDRGGTARAPQLGEGGDVADVRLDVEVPGGHHRSPIGNVDEAEGVAELVRDGYGEGTRAEIDVDEDFPARRIEEAVRRRRRRLKVKGHGARRTVSRGITGESTRGRVARASRHKDLPSGGRVPPFDGARDASSLVRGRAGIEEDGDGTAGRDRSAESPPHQRQSHRMKLRRIPRRTEGGEGKQRGGRGS